MEGIESPEANWRTPPDLKTICQARIEELGLQALGKFAEQLRLLLEQLVLSASNLHNLQNPKIPCVTLLACARTLAKSSNSGKRACLLRKSQSAILECLRYWRKLQFRLVRKSQSAILVTQQPPDY